MPNLDLQGAPQALIVGISGPSSSGKTTLARLLQRIFCGVRLDGSSEAETQGQSAQHQNGKLNTFIIHEDDFYFPDDQIPYTTTPSGARVQDWDTASAIDIPFLSQSLSYVRRHGRLPPILQSKEDQNEISDSGVPDSVVEELRRSVEGRVAAAWKGSSRGRAGGSFDAGLERRTIAFMEGFLLYAPPESLSTTESGYKGNAPLHSVHAQIHLPLFLPASYANVKARREGRSGYVTLGPGPEPPTSTATTTNADAQETEASTDKSIDKDRTEGSKEEEEQVDLNQPDTRPPQNFWVDPPGYVDDIVWPRYVEDHAWLLLPQHGDEDGAGHGESKERDKGKSLSLVERVGDGTAVREDVGVHVAPGKGEVEMEVVLRWAVGEVLGLVCA